MPLLRTPPVPPLLTDPAATGFPWSQYLPSTALWLAAIAALVRWVVGPAVVRYMREDLKPELANVAQIPLMKQQLDGLDCVPTRLERIETLLQMLTMDPDLLARRSE